MTRDRSFAINGQNPYASPKTEETSATKLNDVEAIGPIPFEGVVNPTTLRDALQQKISWSNLAVLFFIGGLCWTVSPLNVFVTSFGRSFLQEIVGLLGVAFLALGIWQLYSAVSSRGLDRRVKGVLKTNPRLYEKPLKGTLHENFIHFDQPESQSWMSWNAIIQYQLGTDIFFVDWGNNASGRTVFERSMFGSDDAFLRARDLLRLKTEGLRSNRLQPKQDYFATAAYDAQKNTDSSPIEAEMEYCLTNAMGRRRIFPQIPIAILQGGIPIHCFFGVMLVAALLFAQQTAACLAFIVMVWLLLMLTAILISCFQHRYLLLRPNDRLMSLKTTVTSNHVYFCSMNGASIVHLPEFHIGQVEHHRIPYRIGDTEGAFERSMYDSEASWQEMVELLLLVQSKQVAKNAGSTV